MADQTKYLEEINLSIGIIHDMLDTAYIALNGIVGLNPNSQEAQIAISAQKFIQSRNPELCAAIKRAETHIAI